MWLVHGSSPKSWHSEITAERCLGVGSEHKNQMQFTGAVVHSCHSADRIGTLCQVFLWDAGVHTYCRPLRVAIMMLIHKTIRS